MSGVCLGWGQRCWFGGTGASESFSTGHGAGVWVLLTAATALVLPTPAWPGQCLQQSQARKLPADTRVCKHEQSSKDCFLSLFLSGLRWAVCEAVLSHQLCWLSWSQACRRAGAEGQGDLGYGDGGILGVGKNLELGFVRLEVRG